MLYLSSFIHSFSHTLHFISTVLLYTYRQYSLGSRLRDHHMSRIRDVSPLGGRTTRMLSASGDSSKSNLHYYPTNYRGGLGSASSRPGVIERDGLPLKNDRFPFSKREEPNEHSSSAAPFHPSVQGMPKVHKAVHMCKCTPVL